MTYTTESGGQTPIDRFTNVLIAAALGGLVGFGGASAAAPSTSPVSPLLPLGVGLAVGGAVMGTLVISAKQQIAQVLKECDRKLASQSAAVAKAQGERGELQRRVSELLGAIDSGPQSGGDIQSLTAQVMALDLDLKRKAQRIAALEHQLKIANESIEDWEENVEKLLESYKAAYSERLEQYKEQEREQLVEEFLAKNKAQAQRITNVIPEAVKKRSERLAAEATAQAAETIAKLNGELSQARQLIERYEAEYVGVALSSEESVETFSSELNDRWGRQVEELQNELLSSRAQAQALREQLKQSSAPIQFAGHCAGNQILKAAHEWCGIAMHGLYRKAESGRETYYFKPIDRSMPTELISTLNLKAGDFKHLLDCKQFGGFAWDSSKLLLSLTLTYHTELVTTESVGRKWLPRSKFPGFAADDCCFRIAGAKRAAKSPTARNILGAKLAMGEKFEVRRFDPSTGSRKDYWRIAPTWGRHSDVDAVSADIEGEIGKRQNRKAGGKPVGHQIYYVLDEVDNTIESADSEAGTRYAAAIFTLIKESEHLGLGVIMSGQSPNVKTFPGKTRADFNNLTNIVIGNMISDALVNSNNSANLTKLTTDFAALTEFCESQNEGQDDPAKLLRFALVDKPGASRKFIELPMLGEYRFDALTPGPSFDFNHLDLTQYPDECRSLSDIERCNLSQSLSVKLGELSPGEAPKASPKPPQQAPSFATAGKASPSQKLGAVSAAAIAEATPQDKPPAQNRPKCPICESSQIQSKGKGMGKHSGKQKWFCMDAKHPQGKAKTFYN